MLDVIGQDIIKKKLTRGTVEAASVSATGKVLDIVNVVYIDAVEECSKELQAVDHVVVYLRIKD